MKRKLLISCMTAVAALLTTSCTSDLALLEGGTTVNGVDGEEVEVTFSVSAANDQVVTRADEDWSKREVKGPGRWQDYVGKGKEIDRLIYAVYEEVKDANGNVTDYSLLTQYGQGYMTYNKNTGEATPVSSSEAAPTGQTIYNNVDVFKEVGGSVKITLRLMRNRTYHVAFWAQNSKTDAYDTHNLKEVKVNYGAANDLKLNNDETRDAFCKVEILSITSGSATRRVILTRPLAQINVGTTGADYKRVVQEKELTATRSEITLEGVAQYFNVVEDKVIVDNTHSLTTVTFDFNKIPAYIQMSNIPETAPESSYTSGDDGIVADANLQKDEEFLKINLDQDKEKDEDKKTLKGYKITYPTIQYETNGQITFLTETFKYLSMCYVLVPAHKIEIPNYTNGNVGTTTDDSYTSSTLESVSVRFEGQNKDRQNKTWTAISELQNVPVHRNWRTNILLGLHDKKPDDPGEDDDPTSIWKVSAFSVTLDSYFNGEYNTTDEGNTWNQDTYGDNPPTPPTTEEGEEEGEE